MYARVARWEGADAQAMRDSVAEIRERSGSGPPEGVPAIGLTLLFDPDSGRGMAISIFETEDDLRKGDATLNEMSPPNDGMGKRVGVDVYEVGVDLRAPATQQAQR